MSSAPRVLVTGASGFVGRSVMVDLGDRGCAVGELTRRDSSAAPTAVVERTKEFKPDVVIHLATHFLAGHDPDDIPELIRSNVEFGTVVAEAASRSGARLVTVESAWQHVNGSAYDPVSLYAATKQALSTVLAYYVNVRGLDSRVVTLFDTYGPHDTRPKLVPALLAAAKSGTIVQMSDGNQLIDLTYVDDVVRGIVGVALEPGGAASSVLRTWDPVTIRQLVQTIEVATGSAVAVEWGARPARPREMTTDWVFGSSPAWWTAEISLEDGIRRCWDALADEGSRT